MLKILSTFKHHPRFRKLFWNFLEYLRNFRLNIWHEASMHMHRNNLIYFSYSFLNKKLIFNINIMNYVKFSKYIYGAYIKYMHFLWDVN